MTTEELIQADAIRASDEARKSGRITLTESSRPDRAYRTACDAIVNAVRTVRRCPSCHGAGELRAIVDGPDYGHHMILTCGTCDGTGEREEWEARKMLFQLEQTLHLVCCEALGDEGE